MSERFTTSGVKKLAGDMLPGSPALSNDSCQQHIGAPDAIRDALLNDRREQRDRS